MKALKGSNYLDGWNQPKIARLHSATKNWPFKGYNNFDLSDNQALSLERQWLYYFDFAVMKIKSKKSQKGG